MQAFVLLFSARGRQRHCDSDITKAGVIRWGNSWCHPIFSSSHWRPF